MTYSRTTPKPHIVIAGQMPPPFGGQNINIKRLYDLLAEGDDFRVSHLKFEFTKEWGAARRASLRKFFEMFRVAGRLFSLRRCGRIDLMIYPAGGPHTVPLVRDIFLLPLMRFSSRRVVVHFQAAGLAERMERSGGALRWLCRQSYRRCSGAISITEFGERDPRSVGMAPILRLPNAYEDQAGGETDHPCEGETVILSVGHLCADKGTPDLIAAFGRFVAASGRDDAILELVGEPVGSYSEEQLAVDIDASGVAGQIRCPGLLRDSNLDDAYRSAHLLVFSSVAPYESFGLVLIEGMQWSLPIIVTDWRANLSVCGERFGGVVAEQPTKGLTGCLEDALTEVWERRGSWKEWGRINRKIYEDRYTMDRLEVNLNTVVRNFLADGK